MIYNLLLIFMIRKKIISHQFIKQQITLFIYKNSKNKIYLSWSIFLND